MATVAVTFALAALLLVVAATALTKAGDAIAERTGIGRVWIGAVLVAGATSLPELATNVSAVRLGAIDLAAGDLFGSSMANMLILALVDALLPRSKVLRSATLDHALLAGLAIILNAMAAAFVLLRPAHGVFGLGPESLVLVAIYVAGTRAVYRQGVRTTTAPPDQPEARQEPSAMSLRRAITQFVIASLAILAAAPVLAHSAEQLATLTGLGSTFIGTMLLGVVTSLPELVASVAAIRLGSIDMAVGNLFGSNAFNMVVFFAMDLAAPAPIFAALDPSHVLSALSAIVLMALGLAAIVYRAARRFALIEPDSLIMLVVYGLSLWLLYAHVTGS